MKPKRINKSTLISRKQRTIEKGYNCPKWIEFCLYLLEKNFEVLLYESKTTVSKYVYIRKNKKQFKVRFSNHKPNKYKEIVTNDCDFFVGITNTGVRTTRDAWYAVEEFFREEAQCEFCTCSIKGTESDGAIYICDSCLSARSEVI